MFFWFTIGKRGTKARGLPSNRAFTGNLQSNYNTKNNFAISLSKMVPRSQTFPRQRSAQRSLEVALSSVKYRVSSTRVTFEQYFGESTVVRRDFRVGQSESSREVHGTLQFSRRNISTETPTSSFRVLAAKITMDELRRATRKFPFTINRYTCWRSLQAFEGGSSTGSIEKVSQLEKRVE